MLGEAGVSWARRQVSILMAWKQRLQYDYFNDYYLNQLSYHRSRIFYHFWQNSLSVFLVLILLNHGLFSSSGAS